ncbi:hypothetical protein DFS34DRAFT_619772 [Phlyctochytrium arcticum]|nr:hypothetical protein DFS34DRAFT_619772 [Phlyctochytrium arcticum]
MGLPFHQLAQVSLVLHYLGAMPILIQLKDETLHFPNVARIGKTIKGVNAEITYFEIPNFSLYDTYTQPRIQLKPCT